MLHAAPCAKGQLRLAGGNIASEGRVEICLNNLWGTVCDDSWGKSDATVVCRQLGYSTQGQQTSLKISGFLLYILEWFVPTDAVAFSSAHFGAGAGPIHLDHVACSGSEDNLIDCSHSSFVSCSGGHREDAGVRCQGRLLCVTVQILLQCIRCCVLY